MLAICSVIFDDFDLDHKKETPVVTGHKLFFAAPMYRDANLGETAAMAVPSLNTQNLCVYFLL
jgi:hypothetical protein